MNALVRRSPSCATSAAAVPRSNSNTAGSRRCTHTAHAQRHQGASTQHGQLRGLKARYTASALAFLGDAVWTMHIRKHYLLPPKHASKYHQAVDKHAAAEMQALYYDCLVAETSVDDEDARSQRDAQSSTPSRVLTGEEHVVLQWALSDPVSFRQRFHGREEKQLAYQKATALEALIGYLSLTDGARLERLLAKLTAYLAEQ